MVHTEMLDVRNNQNSNRPTISDPQQDFGLIPNVSKIEIKWCIRLDNGDEMDLVRYSSF